MDGYEFFIRVRMRTGKDSHEFFECGPLDYDSMWDTYFYLGNKPEHFNNVDVVLKRRSGNAYEFSSVLGQREFEDMNPEYGRLTPEGVEIEYLKRRADRIRFEKRLEQARMPS